MVGDGTDSHKSGLAMNGVVMEPSDFALPR